MPVLGFAILCLIGAFLYLNGTHAADAALVLLGSAAFYVAITALLMRE